MVVSGLGVKLDPHYPPMSGDSERFFIVTGTITNNTNQPVQFYGARVQVSSRQYPTKSITDVDLSAPFEELEVVESAPITGQSDMSGSPFRAWFDPSTDYAMIVLSKSGTHLDPC